MGTLGSCILSRYSFRGFEKWGISGMMVDFMDRDDQEMVNIQTEILEKAAQHHFIWFTEHTSQQV
jgi:hypothetical protein